MSVHLKEIHDAILKTPDKDWTPTIKKIKSQLILRALSCIQIANKLSSNKLVKLLIIIIILKMNLFLS